MVKMWRKEKAFSVNEDANCNSYQKTRTEIIFI